LEWALAAGYRHIDTAEYYKNEHFIGDCIHRLLEKFGLKREDIWITCKVPPWRMSYDEAKLSMTLSLQNLKMDYIDLVLIHWPSASHGLESGFKCRSSTWKAMEEFKAKGLVRSIGVSNFTPRHITELMPHVESKISVN
jgi:diketogulonate reductase-like aldo/keto reductase